MFTCDCCEKASKPKEKAIKQMKTVVAPTETTKAVITEVNICSDCKTFLDRTQLSYAAARKIRAPRPVTVTPDMNIQGTTSCVNGHVTTEINPQYIPLKTTGPLARQTQQALTRKPAERGYKHSRR